MIRVSVAMVTYNGARYVKEQIESVLAGMGEQDELIISDDGSDDGTWAILKDYETKDQRISVIHGPGRGVKQNVSHVLSACSGSYIFLADQDDIWEPGKIGKITEVLEQKQCGLVVHDAVMVGEDGRKVLRDSFYSVKNSGPGVAKNIWRNTYMGCCMAFRRELLKAVLPIPDTIEMHDQWIGILNDMLGYGTCFVPDRLLYYRRHGSNTSSTEHYGIGRMLSNRIAFLRALLQWKRRMKTKSFSNNNQ